MQPTGVHHGAGLQPDAVRGRLDGDGRGIDRVALGLGVPVAADLSLTVDTGDGHREGHVCRGDLVRAPWGTRVQMQRQRHQPEPVVDPVAPGQRVDLAVQRHRRGGERLPQSGRALHHGGGGRPDRQRAVRLPPDGDGAVGEGQSGDVRTRIQPSGESAPRAVLEADRGAGHLPRRCRSRPGSAERPACRRSGRWPPVGRSPPRRPWTARRPRRARPPRRPRSASWARRGSGRCRPAGRPGRPASAPRWSGARARTSPLRPPLRSAPRPCPGADAGPPVGADSGSTRPGERRASREAACSSTGTSRTTTRVLATRQITGARVSVTSTRSEVVAGRPRSCHQDSATTTTAAAIRVQSAPVRAIAQRRRVAADVVLVSTAVSTSTGASARVQPSTVSTSPPVMVGAWASPAAVGPVRWVSHEWTRAAAGRATPAATMASSTASDPAATQLLARAGPERHEQHPLLVAHRGDQPAGEQQRRQRERGPEQHRDEHDRAAGGALGLDAVQGVRQARGHPRERHAVGEVGHELVAGALVRLGCGDHRLAVGAGHVGPGRHPQPCGRRLVGQERRVVDHERSVRRLGPLVVVLRVRAVAGEQVALPAEVRRRAERADDHQRDRVVEALEPAVPAQADPVAERETEQSRPRPRAPSSPSARRLRRCSPATGPRAARSGARARSRRRGTRPPSRRGSGGRAWARSRPR